MVAAIGLIYPVITEQTALSTRLLIAVSVVLTLFLGISAFSLNNAFESSAESEQKRRLQNYVYTLLASAELTQDGLVIESERLAEPKFSIPNSGLYAQITSGDEVVWQSPSLIGRFIALPDHPGPSEAVYHKIQLDEGMRIMNLAFGTVWEDNQGQEHDYTFNVSEELSMLEEITGGFQRSLWYWLGGTGVILLLTQWLILRFSLRPLYQAADDLHAIETGEHQRLTGTYPRELHELTHNINNLLDHEESRRVRYKNSLADLAHSLKTPLAVMRGELDNASHLETLKRRGQEQLDRITSLIDYQLQRAATEGKSNLLAPVSLGEITHKLLNSLNKVYQDKNIHNQCEVERDVFIHADEGDMYELLGNLLENAYKFCNSQVNVIIVSTPGRNVEIRVEDDGNGVPSHARDEIIQRGRRADTAVEGQGLGLSIVSDIIDAYDGDIHLTSSYLGGACFIVTLSAD